MKNFFGPNFMKEPTVENAMIDVFTNTLTGKDSTFAVIAIRCNSKDSVGKRKLTEGILYSLMQGYEVRDECVVLLKQQKTNNVLYDDFFHESINGIPHVQISAIVGQNGSGKSSIVEFMMRLINNFAASTIGELQNSGKAAERLHFIDCIDGELWYVLGNNAYHLCVKNASVRLLKYSEVTEIEEGTQYAAEKPIFDNNQSNTCKEVKSFLSSLGDEELQTLYQCCFYTLISNQSIYAYNTRDYATECNSDKKEALALGLAEDEVSDVEDKCWLHGLFHKNDAYRTPLVITPYRYEGNIDINNEHELAIERLVRLYAFYEDLRTINEHLLVDKLIYSYVPGDEYGLDRIRKKLKFSSLSPVGYKKLKEDIIAKWSDLLPKSLDKCKNKNYYDKAIEYLVYKTLKVSYQYNEHHSFYEAACSMTDEYNSETLGELIKSLALDNSHITRKIYQTIAYLLYDVYELPKAKDTNGHEKACEANIRFFDLAKRWFDKADLKDASVLSNLLIDIRIQAIVPPPFLKIRIGLCEINNRDIEIDFDTLSSGEKQQIYSVSSLLYHLDNIESAHKDKSAPLRVKYENVCIVLEEIELYYHPQLQQQFIHYFLTGLKQITLEHIKSIHLIIVTHSPYVLSDIPRSNVLALKKNEDAPIENLQTFGANIHDMLKDSFFLEGGALGEFAQWEVSHLIACMKLHRWAQGIDDTKSCPFLNSDEECYKFLERYKYLNPQDNKSFSFSYEQFCRDLSADQIKQRIQLIDEPVIYHVLMDEYSRTFPSQTDSQKELKRRELLRQLEELEKS